MNHILNKIKNSKIIPEPYEHLYIEDFIEPELYERITTYINDKIIKNKLYDSHAKSSKHGLNTPYDKKTDWYQKALGNRYQLYIYQNKEIRDNLDKSLIDLHKILINEDIQKLVLDKFQFVRDRSITDLFWAHVDYCEDKIEYPIHCDTNPKNITFIFYLADNDENEHLGTRIYDKNKKLVKITKFKKNSCLIFAPHGDPQPTYHAMRYDNFKDIKYRKSISFNYFNKSKTFTRELNKNIKL